MSLRSSLPLQKSQFKNVLRRGRPHMHKYRELTRWQREAQGISKWDQSHSHRPRPHVERFNPEGVGLTRGTSGFAWRWWYTQYPWLPNVPSAEYTEPRPMGIRPPSWSDEFTDALLAMHESELRSYALEKLTEVIFQETQRDGYELRRLDFEGKPLSSLPERSVMEKFVLEEETLRERVLQRVVEDLFRLTPTSEDRVELKSVENIIDFILTHVTFARPPPIFKVTDAAKAVMRSFPVQPELGFEHALPTDNRERLLKEWEKSHHLEFQFGNAVYSPRKKENIVGNLTWLREQRHHEAREEFMKAVASGEAKERHMEKVRRAAQ